MGAQILYRASNALVFIFIANQFGDKDAGIYTLGLAYFLICSRISFFGLDLLLTREVAKRPDLLTRYFVTFATFRLTISTVLVSAISLFLILSQPYDTDTTTILLVMLFSVIPESLINLNLGCFTSREEVYWNSLTFAVNGMTKLVAGLLVIFYAFPLIGVAYVFLLSQVITMLVSTTIVIKRYVTNWEKPSFNLVKTTMATSSSFFILSLIHI